MIVILFKKGCLILELRKKLGEFHEKNNSERKEVRFKIHSHLHFHLNLEIVLKIPSNREALLDVGAWSSVSLPRCLVGVYLWMLLVLWEQLSRKPGLWGTSWVLSPGAWVCSGGFCLQLIIVLSWLIWTITSWQGNFFTFCDEALKKDTVILFTSWILINVPPNNYSLILFTIHHPQRLSYVDLEWSPNKNMTHENYPVFQFYKDENCDLSIIHSLHFSTDMNLPHGLRESSPTQYESWNVSFSTAFRFSFA